MSKPALLFALCVVPMLAACDLIRGHSQLSGVYELRFSQEDVFRDECGQLAQRPTRDGQRLLWPGTLLITGDEVRMDYGLFDMTLVGSYLEDVERFRLDGSANNVTSTVDQQECLLDLVNVHLDATTREPDRFDGVLQIRYEARRPAICNCEMAVSFQASRVEGP